MPPRDETKIAEESVRRNDVARVDAGATLGVDVPPPDIDPGVVVTELPADNPVNVVAVHSRRADGTEADGPSKLLTDERVDHPRANPKPRRQRG